MATDQGNGRLGERVRRVVGDVLGPRAGDLSSNERFDTLPDWDSIYVTHLLVAVEAEFGVTLEPEEVVELLSCSGVVGLLGRKGVA